MITTVTEIGDGYIVTTGGQFSVASSCSSPIDIDNTVIVVDGFIIAVVDSQQDTLKKIVKVETKKFGKIMLSALQGSLQLMSKDIDIKAGKLSFTFNNVDKGFLCRLSLGKIVIECNEEGLHVKYAGLKRSLQCNRLKGGFTKVRNNRY